MTIKPWLDDDDSDRRADFYDDKPDSTSPFENDGDDGW